MAPHSPQVPDVLYNNMAMLVASPDLTDFDRVMVVSARFHACGDLPQARRACASVHGMVPRCRLHSLHEHILYRYIQSHGPRRVRVVRAVAEELASGVLGHVHQHHQDERHRDATTTGYSARAGGCTQVSTINEQLKHVSSGNGHED